MELTNREIGTAAWLIAVFLWAMTQPAIRLSIWQVVVTAAHPRLAIPAVLYLTYLAAVVSVAARTEVWNVSLLKDTAIWLVAGALPLFGTFTLSHEPRFARRAILRAIAVPELIGFTLGLASFPILVELALLPAIALAAGVAAYSGTKDEYREVKGVMNSTIAIIVLAMVALTAVQLFLTWRQLDWSHMVLSFYLPLWLTAAALPFVYLLGWFSRWEQRRIRRRWETRRLRSG